jgi:hypothetical protein
MPENYCPKCKEKGKWFVKIISYDKGVECSVCNWRAEKPEAPLSPRKLKRKCNIKDSCFHADLVGISYLKCLGCQDNSNFASKDKNNKILTDILWRELLAETLKNHRNYSSVEWREYQIKLIKGSQE